MAADLRFCGSAGDRGSPLETVVFAASRGLAAAWSASTQPSVRTSHAALIDGKWAASWAAISAA